MEQELVSFKELETAYFRWKEVHGPSTFESPSWMKFLDVHPPQHYLYHDVLDKTYDTKNTYWVPLKGAKRIRMLNGPHWETLLKVWAIQDDGELRCYQEVNP